MRVATVKFHGSSSVYDYVVPAWLENSVEEDGYAVVDSPHSGYAVVQVVGVIDRFSSDWPGEHKTLVDVVDVSAYEQSLSARKRERAIMAELDRKTAEAEKLALYEGLAEHDPDIKELLDQLRAARSEATQA